MGTKRISEFNAATDLDSFEVLGNDGPTTKRAPIAVFDARYREVVDAAYNATSIADLRAITTTTVPGSLVFLQSYYADGTSGGGMFWHDAANVAADDGGEVIVDGSARHWVRLRPDPVFSPMEWGATGDGTTDDSTAFQAMLTYAQGLSAPVEIKIPPGRYLINTKLTATLSTVTAEKGFVIRGAGVFATVLIAGTSNTDGVLEIITQNNKGNITVGDMSIASIIDTYTSVGTHNGTALKIRSTVRAWDLGTAQRVTSITAANPPVLTYEGADSFSNGDRVRLMGRCWSMPQVFDKEFLVSNVNTGANTFELQDTSAVNVNGTGFDAYYSGMTVQKVTSVSNGFGDHQTPSVLVENVYVGGDRPSTTGTLTRYGSWANGIIVENMWYALVQHCMIDTSASVRRVVAATTAAVVKNGVQAVDGVTTSNNELILDMHDATAANRGVWLTNSGGAWTRPGRFDEYNELLTTFAIKRGTANAGKFYSATGTPGGTLGVDTFTFTDLGTTDPGIGYSGLMFSACYDAKAVNVYSRGKYDWGFWVTGRNFEGIEIVKSKAVSCVVGIFVNHINTLGSGTFEPGGRLTGNHLNPDNTGLWLRDHQQIAVTDNHFFVGQKAYVDFAEMVCFRNGGSNVVFSGNQVSATGYYNSTTDASMGVLLEANATGTAIIANKFNHGGVSIRNKATTADSNYVGHNSFYGGQRGGGSYATQAAISDTTGTLVVHSAATASNKIYTSGGQSVTSGYLSDLPVCNPATGSFASAAGDTRADTSVIAASRSTLLYSTSTDGAWHIFGKMNNATVTTTHAVGTLVATATILGGIAFEGSDGANFKRGATIRAETIGTPAAGVMPAKVVIAASTLTGQTPQDRFLVDINGMGHAKGDAKTQNTSKATAVTLDFPTGQITMNNALLGAGAVVSFTVNNSTIGANDVVVIHRKSGGTAGSYDVWIDSVAAGSFVVSVKNITGGGLSEAVVLQFATIKGAIA